MYTYNKNCKCIECKFTTLQAQIDELKKNDVSQVEHIQRLLDAEGLRLQSIPQSDAHLTLVTIAKKWKVMIMEQGADDTADAFYDTFAHIAGIENPGEIVKALERYAQL